MSRNAAFQWWTRRLCRQPQMALTLPSSTREREKHARTGFLVTKLPKSAVLQCLLILILLLRAGINSNPGPYTCSSCNHKVLRSQASVWCHVCGCIHLKCSDLHTLKYHNRDFLLSQLHTKLYIAPSKLPIPQERIFCDTVLYASRHHINAGRHRFFVPALNDETKKPVQHRDRDIMTKTVKRKEKKRREFLQTFRHHTSSSKFWKAVRSLNGSKSLLMTRRFYRRKTLQMLLMCNTLI